MTGRVWPSSPLSHKYPYSSQSFRVQLPLLSLLQCPLSQPPQSPLPLQHAAAQPMGIVQFCTLLLHRLVGVAVDKPQGKRWAC